MDNLAIFTYFLKTAIVSAFFYAAYRLLFQKDTFLKFKRVFLLGALMATAIIPLINVHLSNHAPAKVPTAWMSEIVVTPTTVATVTPNVTTIDWQTLLIAGIALISLVFGVRLCIQLIEICRLKYKNVSRKEKDCVLINLKKNEVSSFSFFKWIFVSNQIWSAKNCDEILRHELVHAKQWHSADVMLAELFCIVFWWNPFCWLIRHEIRINHEFLADRGVLQQGCNSQQYQYLLLNTLTVTNRIPINNHFNISQLKKRIAMMNKQQSNKWTAAKYLLALPLVALLIIGNAVKASNSENPLSKTIGQESKDDTVRITVKDVEKKEPEKVVIQVKDDDKSKKQSIAMDEVVVVGYSETKKQHDVTITVTDYPKSTTTTRDTTMNGKNVRIKVRPITESEKEMPQYPGGEAELMRYLSSHIKYPTIAANKGIQGMVVVRFTVEETGSIKDIQVLKGVDPALDKEAVRVVEGMPSWEPGIKDGKAVSVYYTLPIKFDLRKK